MEHYQSYEKIYNGLGIETNLAQISKKWAFQILCNDSAMTKCILLRQHDKAKMYTSKLYVHFKLYKQLSLVSTYLDAQ